MFKLDDKQEAALRLAWRMHTSTQGPMPSELARYIYLLMDKAGVTSLDSQRQFRIKMTEAMRREQDEFSA
jgi:hypothetical protein